MSVLVTSLGTLISLRSPTVQSAAQSLMLMLFMPFLLLQAVVFLLPTFLPAEVVKGFLAQLDFLTIALVVLGIMLVISFGLFFAAVFRFKRSKLILS
jgi:hypothetical protein